MLHSKHVVKKQTSQKVEHLIDGDIVFGIQSGSAERCSHSWDDLLLFHFHQLKDLNHTLIVSIIFDLDM